LEHLRQARRVSPIGGGLMTSADQRGSTVCGGPVPRNVKKAIAYMRQDLGRAMSMADLVKHCGVAERTLHKNFALASACLRCATCASFASRLRAKACLPGKCPSLRPQGGMASRISEGSPHSTAEPLANLRR
jgi:hypothetical protein